MEEQNIIKINFFKKIWYSITKISKYEEMKEEGINAGLKYFLSLIAILGFIMAIISTIVQINSLINPAIKYLEGRLPEMTFKDNHLTLKENEAKIFDEEQFKMYFGNVVVINTLLEEQEAIDEYYKMSSENYKCTVFLNDEYITIKSSYNPESGSKEGVTITKYADVSANYITDASKEYTEKDVVEFISKKASISYYVMQFFFAYIIMIGILYGISITIISFFLWGMTKIIKLNWTLKKSFLNTIYSTTLSIIFLFIYLILSYFTKFRIPYYDILTFILVFIYIYLLIYKERKEIREKK